MRKTSPRLVLMEMFGASPAVRVLDCLLNVYTLGCFVSDIAENAQVSRTTPHYMIMPDLVKNEALSITRKLGRIKLYKLNEKNPLVKKLLEVDKELILGELSKRLPRKTAPLTA